MKVFLKGTPLWLARRAVNAADGNWIYFGSDFQYAQQLESALGAASKRIRFEELLYRISNDRRKDFIQWIDAVSELNQGSEEWYYSAAANKNPYFSKLFISVCYFLVFDALIEKGQRVDAVFVDSPALAGLIRQRCSTKDDHFFFNDFVNLGLHFCWFTKSVVKYFRFILKSVQEFILARCLLKGRVAELLKENKNILIRAYVSEDFIDGENNILERHYFPGLYKYYEDQGLRPVFLAFALNTKGLAELFRKILKSKVRIIFPCEIFRWKDYVYAFQAPFRKLFRTTAVPMPSVKFDLSKLLDEEALIHRADDETLTAFLFSRFARAFKARGFSVECLVNWCEFQNFEKGLMRGMRHEFPGVRILGAQPFLKPANHVSLFPSRQDVMFGAMPDKLLVLGSLDKALVQDVLPDACFDYSPAFRYQSIFRSRSSLSGKNVFVLLGYGLSNTLHILKVLLALQNDLKGFGKVLIKLHPASYFGERRIRRIINEDLPDHFQFVDGRVEDYLDSAALGICGATGTSVELAVRGIPVILIAETYGLTMDYLQVSDDHLWRLCFSPQEVLKAVKELGELKNHQPDLLMKRAALFQAQHFVEQNPHLWENYL